MTGSSDAASATGRTLEEVEAESWGDPPADASHVVARCYALRRVPLGQLGTEDLRILLGQSIGVATLVPLALRVLGADPLSEGDLYPGDLLASVLRLDPAYWENHPNQGADLAAIAARVDPSAAEVEGTQVPSLIATFLRGHGGGNAPSV